MTYYSSGSLVALQLRMLASGQTPCGLVGIGKFAVKVAHSRDFWQETLQFLAVWPLQ